MPAAERRKQGQTSLEYLLLLAVVAVIVIASFSQGSLITQVHDSAQSYYNSVTQVIMGKNPNPINGGWCPVTCPSGNGPNSLFGSCECPAPAFGGKPCPGSGANGTATTTETCGAGQTCPGAFKVDCSGVGSCSCPTGLTCNSSGACVCGNGLVCCDSSGQPSGCSGPSGSVANTACTQCICASGTQYYGPAPGTCAPICSGVCTTWNGTACVPQTCPGNQYCDTTPGAGYGLCQCISGTYWTGVTCAPYCTQVCQTWNGSACVPTVCSLPNMYCDTTPGPGYGSCQCESPYICWNGTACVLPAGNGSCSCTPSTPCPSSGGCGTDSCGNNCGSCPSPQTCSSSTPGTPGTCSAGSGCIPNGCNIPQATCDSNLGTNNCGVCVGQANQCPVDAQGQQESCFLAQCVCGTCTPIFPCGSTAGFDNCGNSCKTIAGTCPSGESCNSSNVCACQSNGVCNPIFPCGSSAGFDNCGNSCTATPGTCPTGETCNASNVCACQPNGTCTPIYPCGSTSGFDNCGNSCTATPGTCPSGEACGSGNACVPCTPNGTCTASCGSTSGFDNCNDPCTTTSPGTSCPVGETCTGTTCVCTTPGICPTGSTCGPDTCGNANGCNGPNACSPGESCTSGNCVPSCQPCQTWNGTTCVSTIPCGSAQCGTDSCGNTCGPLGGACPTGQNCSSGQCIPTCPACESWNGSACAATTPCGGAQCGTDSCGVACGPNNGICPTGQVCSAAGACVPNCLSCQTWDGSTCVTTTPCGTDQCGKDSCGVACGPDGGLCPTNQTCASGQCVDCPNCTGAACGASDGCGGICQTGTCTNGTCTAGQCITTFTLQITDYANCNTCNQMCPMLDLQGQCGASTDCGASCGITYSACTQDPTDNAWNCGSCLQETLSGTACQNGIASVISQTVGSGGQSGNCLTGAPGTPSTVTYKVVCNP